jgi:hypothetical protein
VLVVVRVVFAVQEGSAAHLPMGGPPDRAIFAHASLALIQLCGLVLDSSIDGM